ncbi:hypothetical protein BASA81_012555 [Batrachochytrium salamandrivorans]|nr:hypothetical protein BASA81_012555 [Batrachochytrium salamandrivorans]
MLATKRFLSSGVNWRGRARFYGEVDVAHDSVLDKFFVLLDGKAVRTPGMNPFALPTRALAGLVAQEWDSQICVLETSTMPLTMQCATAIDITCNRRDGTVAELLRYLTTDVVCFPAQVDLNENSGETKKLHNFQQERWKLALGHFAQTYGQLQVLDSNTLVLPKHDPEAIAKVTHRLHDLCDFKLNAMNQLAHGCKSLVLPLALLDRASTVEGTLLASRAEEDHQIGNWGLVEGSHDVDESNLRCQISAASMVLWLA